MENKDGKYEKLFQQQSVWKAIFSMAVPALLTNGNNAQGYLLAMSVIACVAVPLTFVQYFYTRERVTEERRNHAGIREPSFLTGIP